MNIHDIYGLIDRFEKSCMSEMEVELDGSRFSCKKNTGNGNNAVVTVGNAVQTLPLNGSTDAESGSNASQIAAEGNAQGNDVPGIEIRAKVAGTFYRASSPESEPFVQVGQTVRKGDTVGMIEAMKMMNDITAPADGEILEIIAKNEELVGYDDVLIILKEV